MWKAIKNFFCRIFSSKALVDDVNTVTEWTNQELANLRDDITRLEKETAARIDKLDKTIRDRLRQHEDIHDEINKKYISFKGVYTKQAKDIKAKLKEVEATIENLTKKK